VDPHSRSRLLISAFLFGGRGCSNRPISMRLRARCPRMQFADFSDRCGASWTTYG